MTIPLVIIGAGGFGREVQDVVDAVNAQALRGGGPDFDFVGYLDDGTPDVRLLGAAQTLHLGGVSSLEHLPRDVAYVIGIANGAARRKIDTWATALGRRAATLIHPSAVVGARLVSIGEGSVVCATAVITTNVRLGRHVHVNLGATVGHDAVVGDYVTVNPNASISGGVVLEDEVNLGTCSSVIQGRRVGARTTVGAGAAVVRDLAPDVIAVGVPARPRG